MNDQEGHDVVRIRVADGELVVETVEDVSQLLGVLQPHRSRDGEESFSGVLKEGTTLTLPRNGDMEQIRELFRQQTLDQPPPPEEPATEAKRACVLAYEVGNEYNMDCIPIACGHCHMSYVGGLDGHIYIYCWCAGGYG